MSRKPVLRVILVVMTMLMISCADVEENKGRYFEKGLQEFSAGEYEKARLNFKNILQIDPNDADARYYLGFTFEKMENYPKAVNNYREALNQNPSHADAAYRLGQIYILATDFVQAQNMIAILQAQPGRQAQTYTLQAAMSARQGDKAAAMLDARRALDSSPNYKDAVVLLSAIYLSQENADEAVKLLSSALQAEPQDQDFNSLLAQAYIALDQYAEAEQVMRALVKSNPEVYRHRVNLVALLVERARDDDAIAVLEQAISEQLEVEESRKAILRILTQGQRFEQAISRVLEWQKTDPREAYLIFAQAELLEHFGRTREAMDIYSRMADWEYDTANRLKAKRIIAGKHIEKGEFDEAWPLLEEVLTENPSDVLALQQRGVLYLSRSDYRAAIADFRSILSVENNNVVVLQLLARAHLDNGEPKLAKQQLEKAVELKPRDLDLRVELAKIQASLGEVEQATTMLESSISQSAPHLNSAELLARLYLGRNELDKADLIVSRLDDNYGDNTVVAYLHGLIAQRRSKLDLAIDYFRSAVEKSPRAIEPLGELVKTYHAAGRSQEAIDYLNTLYDKDPDNLMLPKLLGDIYYQNGDSELALVWYRKAIAINPRVAILYRQAALIEAVSGNTEAAVKLFEQGYQNSANVDLLMDLGNFYLKQNNVEQALVSFERVLEQQQDSMQARSAVAKILVDHKPTEKNVSRARQLVKGFGKSSNPMYVDIEGWVELVSGDQRAAVTLFEKAVSLQPEFPLFRYHLGKAYYELGNFASARENLLLATNSDFPYGDKTKAEELLQMLEKS